MTPEIKSYLSTFIEWASFGIISTVSMMAVGYLKSIKDSIVELNKQVAIIIERAEWHEKRLDALESQHSHRSRS